MKNLFHHFHEIFSSDFYHKISCGQGLTSIMRPPVPVQCTYGTEFSLGVHCIIITRVQYGSRVTRIFLES